MKENTLYRGSRIKKSELEYIKKAFENNKNKKNDLPVCFCYNKAFLSSTIKENIGFKFMIRKEKEDNEEYILYKLNKGNEVDNKNASNSNIQEFSIYPDFFSDFPFLFVFLIPQNS